MSAPLSREEFINYMDLFKEMVDDGFTRVQQKQDLTNGRLLRSEGRLDKLETAQPPSTAWSDIKGKVATAASVGAGLAGAIAAIWQALK